MIKHTSWLFAAAMLAGTAVHAQEKVKETKKPAPPVIEKHSSPSAKAKPVGKVKMSDLKPETRAKIESGEKLTEEDKAEIKKAVRPRGATPPPPPPALPPKQKN